MKQNIATLTILLSALLLLSACQKPSEKPPQIKAAAPAQKVVTEGDAFASSWIVGQKKWSFQGAKLNLRRSSTITDDTLESWSGECQTVQPLEVEALEERVTLRFSSLRCAEGDLPAVLSKLFAITRELGYVAEADAKNEKRFVLALNPAALPSGARWESSKAGESAMDDKSLILEFDANEIRPREIDMGSHVRLRIRMNDEQKQTKLRLELVSDNFDTREQVEIQLEASLEVVP